LIIGVGDIPRIIFTKFRLYYRANYWWNISRINA